jgi:hypothetical protein
MLSVPNNYYATEEAKLRGAQPRFVFTFFSPDVGVLASEVADPGSLKMESPFDFSNLVAGEHTLKLFDPTGKYNPDSGSFIFGGGSYSWFGKGIRVAFGFVRPGTQTVDAITLYEGKILSWKRTEEAGKTPTAEVYSKDWVSAFMEFPLGVTDDSGNEHPLLINQPLVDAEDAGDDLPSDTWKKWAGWEAGGSPGAGLEDGNEYAGDGVITTNTDPNAWAGFNDRYTFASAANAKAVWYFDFGSLQSSARFQGYVRFDTIPDSPAAEKTCFSGIYNYKNPGQSGCCYVELYSDEFQMLVVKSKRASETNPKTHTTSTQLTNTANPQVKIAFVFQGDSHPGVVKVYVNGQEAWTNAGNWNGESVSRLKCGPQLAGTAEAWGLTWDEWYATWPAPPIVYQATCKGYGGITDIIDVFKDGVDVPEEAFKRSRRQRHLDRKLNLKRLHYLWALRSNWSPWTAYSIAWLDIYNKPSGSMCFQVQGINYTHPVDIISYLINLVSAQMPGLSGRIDTATFQAAKAATPAYAISCNFKDISCGEAAKEITSRLLYNIYGEEGKIKIKAYTGSGPSGSVLSISSSMLKVKPLEYNFEDIVNKVRVQWGWYDMNNTLYYVTQDSNLISQLGLKDDQIDLSYSSCVAMDTAYTSTAQTLAQRLLTRMKYPPKKCEIEGWFDYLPRLQLWDCVALDGVNHWVYSKEISQDGCKIGLVRFPGEA